MKHFLFHLMPYKGVTNETEKYGTAWVWSPNSNFDPKKAVAQKIIEHSKDRGSGNLLDLFLG
jgi:hypothetical protein